MKENLLKAIESIKKKKRFWLIALALLLLIGSTTYGVYHQSLQKEKVVEVKKDEKKREEKKVQSQDRDEKEEKQEEKKNEKQEEKQEAQEVARPEEQKKEEATGVKVEPKKETIQSSDSVNKPVKKEETNRSTGNGSGNTKPSTNPSIGGGKTEQPKAHTHNFQPIYTVVTVTDKEAWSEQVPVYGLEHYVLCGTCGQEFYSAQSLREHQNATIDTPQLHGGFSSGSRSIITGYNTVNHPAITHQEQRIAGYRCNECGATK